MLHSRFRVLQAGAALILTRIIFMLRKEQWLPKKESNLFLDRETGMRMWSEDFHKKEGSLEGTKHGEFISNATIFLL